MQIFQCNAVCMHKSWNDWAQEAVTVMNLFITYTKALTLTCLLKSTLQFNWMELICRLLSFLYAFKEAIISIKLSKCNQLKQCNFKQNANSPRVAKIIENSYSIHKACHITIRGFHCVDRGFWYSGMLKCVAGLTELNILKEHSAFAFKSWGILEE